MKVIRDTRGLLAKVDVDYFSEHNHSEISNLRIDDSTIRIPTLINRSIELGYKGVALTDHECLSGHVRFLQRYNELKVLKEKYDNYIKEEDFDGLKKDKGVQKEIKLLEKMSNDFKIGLGNEIYLVENLEDVRENYESGVTKFYHFVLMAKDREGYQQLRELSSRAWENNYFRTGKMERVPTTYEDLIEVIGDNKGHLIASSACLGGALPTHTIGYYRDGSKEAKEKIKEFMRFCIDMFGKENFFIELQPTIHLPNDNIMEQHPQITFNQNVFKIAKAFHIDNFTVATDSHYLKKEDREIHKAFLTSDEDNNSAREVDDFYETTYMMSKEEIYECLSTHLTDEQIEQAFAGTMKIHSMLEEYDLAHDVIVPRDKNIPEFEVMHLFKGWYNKYPILEKFANSEDEQDRYYLYLCEKGFLKKNMDIMDEIYPARISEEIETIDKISQNLNQHLSAYYVLVRGLIQDIMWKVSYVGIARGSVTGWFCAYLMEITQMNPLKYDLPCWRHLNGYLSLSLLFVFKGVNALSQN